MHAQDNILNTFIFHLGSDSENLVLLTVYEMNTQIKNKHFKQVNLSKFGKLNSGHRTGKGPFSFQSQRKAMPENAQTTAQLHSSHTLVK